MQRRAPASVHEHDRVRMADLGGAKYCTNIWPLMIVP